MGKSVHLNKAKIKSIFYMYGINSFQHIIHVQDFTRRQFIVVFNDKCQLICWPDFSCGEDSR